MQLQGQVLNAIPNARLTGPQNIFQDFLSAAGVSEILPRYAALAYSGMVFSTGQTAAAALTAAGTTTTGLTLWNPTGSGKNLVLLDCTLGITPVTLATVGISVMLGGGIQAATPTFGTALTPVTTLIGSSYKSVASAGTGSTTIAVAPSASRVVASWESTVLTTSGGATAVAATLKDEIAGAIIVAPGSVVTLYGIGTVADATVNACLTWAELPV